LRIGPHPPRTERETRQTHGAGFGETDGAIFEVGSQAARLINAVTGTPSGDGAKAILQAVMPDVQGKEAVRKLDEIKALLVQM
jgi:hypothetical protein